MAKELPKRSEVDVKDTWNLNDMYDSVEAWEADLSKIKEIASKIEKMEGHIADSAISLYETLSLEAELNEKIMFAFNYAERLFDEDTTNTTHQAMSAKIFSIYADIAGRISFIDPEILAIDEAKLERFYGEVKELELYRNFIKEIQRLKEHCLSAEMEKLIAMTSEMSQTSSDTYSMLNDADMDFPEVEDANGEKVKLSHGRFIRLLESADRNVRENTFKTFYGAYKQFLNTYASLYNGQVKQQIFYAKARKYNSTLEAAVIANDVSPKVYKILVDTVNANLDKLHRYVALRKKLLRVDELHMYDIYPSMIPDMSKTFTFDEAKELVLKALKPLGDEYVAKVKEGFENRWIDVYENQGKRSGAYSAGAFGTHPYVLLNFNGTLDDVFTMIHEMGHAMHSYYSNNSQPFIYSDYKIFVAEVASTCNEVLLLEYLLNNTEDKKERAYLLNHYLDMFKGTLFRQTQFGEYEMITNKMVEDGEALNADNLSQAYLELNKKYYGPDMISDDEIAYEWARIPHFYYNFYVYQYATSFSAAVTIAHDILRDGAVVVDKYKEFLKGGCSKAPVDLLRGVGIDLETSKPIQDAMDVMDEVLDEMESLEF